MEIRVLSLLQDAESVQSIEIATSTLVLSYNGEVDCQFYIHNLRIVTIDIIYLSILTEFLCKPFREALLYMDIPTAPTKSKDKSFNKLKEKYGVRWSLLFSYEEEVCPWRWSYSVVSFVHYYATIAFPPFRFAL